MITDWGIVLHGAAANIYWTEVAADDGTSEFAAGINVPGQASMRFFTYWSTITDNWSTLYKSIIGGYDLNSSGTRWTPWACPYAPNCYATYMDAKPYIVNGTTSSGGKVNYVIAVVDVHFESLPYTVASNRYPNWTTVAVQATNYRVPYSFGTFVFNAGSFTGKPAIDGGYVNQGVQRVRMTFHQIPASAVFVPQGGAPQLILTTNPNLGTINSSAFLGYPEGTLLFNDSEAPVPIGSPVDAVQLYDYTINLMYTGVVDNDGNPIGWNACLDPGGSWNQVQGIISGKPPWTSSDFNTMLANIGF